MLREARQGNAKHEARLSNISESSSSSVKENQRFLDFARNDRTSWRFTEWSRREPSDIDGKPEGAASWRKQIKRPTMCPCLTRNLWLPSSWEVNRTGTRCVMLWKLWMNSACRMRRACCPLIERLTRPQSSREEQRTAGCA